MHPIDIIFRPVIISAAVVWLVAACHPGGASGGQPMLTGSAPLNDFGNYWYQGEGEIDTYDIEQSRYGELRKGEGIMVFVYEDFSKSKQVKLDNPTDAETDKIPVLKLNNLRRFTTGIYDYSMMQSVFTPVDLKKHPATIKLTLTSQDWCGHSFLQLNLAGAKYKVSQFSYFESEGDKTYQIAADFLEDELLTLIRIAPEHIKEGRCEVIPSSFYSRLLHDPLKPRQARIAFDRQGDVTYLTLEYLHLDRTLVIGFESNFPRKILSWKELQNGTVLSKGKLKASMKSAYWRQHDNKHLYLRDSLKLGL